MLRILIPMAGCKPAPRSIRDSRGGQNVETSESTQLRDFSARRSGIRRRTHSRIHPFCRSQNGSFLHDAPDFYPQTLGAVIRLHFDGAEAVSDFLADVEPSSGEQGLIEGEIFVHLERHLSDESAESLLAPGEPKFPLLPVETLTANRDRRFPQRFVHLKPSPTIMKVSERTNPLNDSAQEDLERERLGRDHPPEYFEMNGGLEGEDGHRRRRGLGKLGKLDAAKLIIEVHLGFVVDALSFSRRADALNALQDASTPLEADTPFANPDQGNDVVSEIVHRLADERELKAQGTPLGVPRLPHVADP